MSAPRTLVLALLLAGPAFAAAPAQRALGTGVLNMNTASQEQLDALPGVSPKLARDIVEHRKAHPFARTEEVLKVKGFGRNRFQRLKPHLAVTGPTTFRPSRTSRPRPPMTPLARSGER